MSDSRTGVMGNLRIKTDLRELRVIDVRHVATSEGACVEVVTDAGVARIHPGQARLAAERATALYWEKHEELVREAFRRRTGW